MGAMVTSTESVLVGHCGRPLAILVGSYPRWIVSLARVSSTDLHILSCYSDVFMGFIMIARDPEWLCIAMGVTIDLSNEHFIRFI